MGIDYYSRALSSRIGSDRDGNEINELIEQKI